MDLINTGIILAYIMIGFGAIIAIGFGLKKMIESSNSALKSGYALAGLTVVLIFSYMLASDSVLTSYEEYEITASTSKRVGIGLYSFYIHSILHVFMDYNAFGYGLWWITMDCTALFMVVNGLSCILNAL